MTDGLVLAARSRRLVATVIDAVLVPSLTLLLVLITGVVEDAEDFVDYGWIARVLLLAVLSYLLLNGYGLWRSGQTLGKHVMGVAIVPAVEVAEGRYGNAPAPLWRLICVRALFFPMLFLSVVPWIAALPIIDQLLIFGRHRRCLHDFISGTVVVRLRPRAWCT
jgi:uncharacterized RDD family membrane protein YckC